MTYHLVQTAAAVMVLGVCLKMLGKVYDSLSEQSDLYFGGTGVALVGRVALDNQLLFVLQHRFFHLSK